VARIIAYINTDKVMGSPFEDELLPVYYPGV
jgi:hypothetical protein